MDEFKVNGASSTVGLEELSAPQTSVSLYPNPSSTGRTTLEIYVPNEADMANIYLTNILGKRVQEIHNGNLSKGENRFEINTAQLGAGIYFLTMEQNGERITKKLILN